MPFRHNPVYLLGLCPGSAIELRREKWIAWTSACVCGCVVCVCAVLRLCVFIFNRIKSLLFTNITLMTWKIYAQVCFINAFDKKIIHMAYAVRSALTFFLHAEHEASAQELYSFLLWLAMHLDDYDFCCYGSTPEIGLRWIGISLWWRQSQFGDFPWRKKNQQQPNVISERILEKGNWNTFATLDNLKKSQKKFDLSALFLVLVTLLNLQFLVNLCRLFFLISNVFHSTNVYAYIFNRKQ